MEVIHPCCAGLDVHKETVVACTRRTLPGGRIDEQVRTFSTTTGGLLELGDWLVEQQVPIAAMESTGVYWKPVWNLLEGRLELMLVNAREVRQLLGSVASDVLGVSGREMIRALMDGKMSPEQMAELSRRRLRLKIPQLRAALTGRVSEHHRFMRRRLLEEIEHYEQHIARLDRRIEEVMSPLEKTALTLLDEIPGIDRRAAQNVLAEIGTDMSRFPSAGHLASWAGLCPGNDQSAGKRRSGRMSDGNRWLKGTLNQCAWAASRKKDSYFAAQHRRIASRRGVKRATMAVAHTQLCVCWELLKHGQCYRDMGRDYFDRTHEERVKRQLVKRLEKLGYAVTINKKDAA